MSEGHHTKEQVDAAFAAVPEMLRRLQEAGIDNPSVELHSDASGKLVLGHKGDTFTDEQIELAIDLVKSQRPYDMFGVSDKIGITSCCGFVFIRGEFAMSAEVAMLEQQIESMKTASSMQKSSFTNLLIDIQVALEDDDIDEAILMIKEELGEVKS